MGVSDSQRNYRKERTTSEEKIAVIEQAYDLGIIKNRKHYDFLLKAVNVEGVSIEYRRQDTSKEVVCVWSIEVKASLNKDLD